MKRKVEIGFIIALVLAFSYAAIKALNWKIYASLFPYMIGCPMILLAFIQLFLTAGVRETPAGENAASHTASDIDDSLIRRRTLRAVSWIIGLLITIFFLGFSTSVFLFTFLYLMIESREKLWFSCLLTIASWIFFYGFFGWGLKVPLPEGLLFRLLT